MKIRLFLALTVTLLISSGCGGSGGGKPSPSEPGVPLVVKSLGLVNPTAALNSVCRGVSPGEYTFEGQASFEGPTAKLYVEVIDLPGNNGGLGAPVVPGDNPSVPVKTRVTGTGVPGGIKVRIVADGTGASDYKAYSC